MFSLFHRVKELPKNSNDAYNERSKTADRGAVHVEVSPSPALNLLSPTFEHPTSLSDYSWENRSQSGRSADELRLLGDYDSPPDAVPIPRPGATLPPTTMRLKPSVGGFRPVDNISHGHIPTQGQINRSPVLACESSRGDNVGRRYQIDLPLDDISQAPKRRKTDHRSNIIKSGTFELSDQDDQEGTVAIARKIPLKSSSRESLTQRSSSIAGPKGSSIMGGHHEGKDTERNLHPQRVHSGRRRVQALSSNTPKTQPRPTVQIRGYKVSGSISPPANSPEGNKELVVISDDEDVPKMRSNSGHVPGANYLKDLLSKINAVEDPLRTKTRRNSPSRVQSHYFQGMLVAGTRFQAHNADAMEIDNHAHSIKPLGLDQPIAPLNAHRRATGHARKPVSPVAMRQVQDQMDIEDSFDELAGPATMPMHESLATTNLNDDAQTDSPPDADDGYEIPESPPTAITDNPADIQPTKFTSSSTITRRHKATRASAQAHQPYEQAKWPLVKINLGGRGAFDGQPLLMFFEGKNVGFTFRHGSRPMDETDRLRPEKIGSLQWSPEDDCTLVRVGFSKDADDRYPKSADLQFQRYGDVKQFIQVLKACFLNPDVIRITEKTKREMEQIFKRQPDSRPRSIPLAANIPVDAGVEEWLLEARFADRRQIQHSEFPELGRSTNNFSRSTNQRGLLSDRLHSELKQRKSQRKSQPSSSDSHTPPNTTQSNGSDNKDPVVALTGKPPTLATADRALRSSIRIRQPPVYYDPEAETKVIEKYSKVHGLGEPWSAPVVFPETGRRTTVHFEDLKRLDEGEWINDTLIEFYINWLFNKFKPPETQVYAFSTHFYTALTSGDKTQRGINFNAVRRWTSKVDLFTYDYIIVPINESDHWYLALICNLPNVQRKVQVNDSYDGPTLESENAEVGDGRLDAPIEIPESQDAEQRSRLGKLFDDNVAQELQAKTSQMKLDSEAPQEDSKDEKEAGGRIRKKYEASQTDGSGIFSHIKISSPKSIRSRRKSGPPPRKYAVDTPAVVILDSLQLARQNTIRKLKEYLVAEGADKRGLEVSPNAFQGLNARSGIPTQDNWYDCGIFILGYLHKFMEDPKSFARKLLLQEFDVEIDWPQMDPSRMRAAIRDVLQDIASHQSLARKNQKAAKQAKKRATAGGDSVIGSSPSKGPGTVTPPAIGSFATAPGNTRQHSPRVVIERSPVKSPLQQPQPSSKTHPQQKRNMDPIAVSIEEPADPPSPDLHTAMEFEPLADEEGQNPNGNKHSDTLLLEECEAASVAHGSASKLRSATPDTVTRGNGDFMVQLQQAANGELPRGSWTSLRSAGLSSLRDTSKGSAPSSAAGTPRARTPKARNLRARGMTPDNPVEID